METRLVRAASEFRRGPMFQASFHSIVTSRASWYAPPDTGVPNLQLVSVEYLPSIEGALEIQMNVTFLRGKAPLPGADSPYQGEMSRRDKRGRDAVTEGDGEVAANLRRPLRLGFAEPPPLSGEAWLRQYLLQFRYSRSRSRTICT